MKENVFDKLAERYDRWFDSSDGRLLFETEVDCLGPLVDIEGNRWCEIGVGTGRFAQALGIKEGIDPSEAVLEFARKRGIEVVCASAENLPYSDETFDGLLMVVTLCFLDNPIAAFKEAYRVLRNGASLVVGFVPADSSWGRKYIRQAKEGHPFYSSAKFYTVDEVKRIAERTGFIYDGARSCLFSSPEAAIDYDVSIEGIVGGAGFVAIRFKKS